LQKYDQNLHDEQNVLFLFSSIIYAKWVLCNAHHKTLKDAFKLKNHSTRKILTNRMNKIWKR
jgi:hypothetical protein